MAVAITQKQRLLTISTPLGADVLLVKGFNATENLSGLFYVNVDLMVERSKAAQVNPEALIGQLATLSIAIGDDFSAGKTRHFNGMIRRFALGSQDDRFSYCTMQMVPWTWLLSQKAGCRVFQDKSALDIIKAIFDEIKGKFSSLVKYKDSTTKSYTKLDYCVQYRESDFNFVTRLMEEEGIFYFFKHTKEGHELVLADSADTCQPCEHQSEFVFAPEGGTDKRDKDAILSWHGQQEMRPGKHVCRDYHFQMPGKVIEVSETTKKAIGESSKLEVYDWPGDYAHRFNKPDERLGDVEKEGQALVKARMEADDANVPGTNGTSSARMRVTGGTFKMQKHPDKTQNKEYCITSVQHNGVQSPSYVSNEESAVPYYNSFTCIPSGLPYRPRRVTPKPIVEGLQSAVVVGPSGEEIWTDKYGRIRVQFHWDRNGKKDENSTCWLRVAQIWAGQKWGAHFWPRIGQEVLVGFLEGNPDHPIVIGSLYNAENMPPYEMPANQTRSGIKTRSTKQGGDDNFNELRFEDKKGEEEIYFHAEKDFNRVVENNDSLKVGFDKKGDGNQKIEIFNNQDLTVGNAQAKQGNQTIEVWKDQTTKIKTGNRDVTIEMGNDALNIKLGNQTTKLDLGKSETEAMQSIELKVGQSSVKVDQTGVTIKGMKISIEGQMLTTVKGLMTQVNGDAMLTVKGGLTMIN